MEKENTKDIEINFQDIFMAIIKRIWIPIIAAIIFYIAGFWYSTNGITPMYTSQAELLVISNNAAYIQQTALGAPAIVEGVPVRYAHSAHNISSYEDFEYSVKMLIALLENITPEVIAAM